MKQWALRVEWARPAQLGDHLTDEQAEALDEHLAAHAGHVGEENNGNLSANLGVEARTPRQAFDAALRAVEAACKAAGMRCEVVAVDLLPQEEFERRQHEPVVPPLVGPTEIGERLGVSRQRASELIRENPDKFPVVARTSRGALYLESSLKRFQASWQRRSGRPRKSAAAAPQEG